MRAWGGDEKNNQCPMPTCPERSRSVSQRRDAQLKIEEANLNFAFLIFNSRRGGGLYPKLIN
jgi:hypothetical protein